MKTRTAKVVIGANYGDEGKGMATDALAARDGDDNTAVIRFNGGAQAGHTVTAPDGRRHVFSHFGAGSFAGAATYLSEFFVLHPTMFVREAVELAEIGVVPEVLADPDAQITTPYDVMVNRWAEGTRGRGRHGSVGIGFGETVERALGGHPLAVRDLGADKHLAEMLERIRTEWLPERVAMLGIEYTPERLAVAADPAVAARFIAETRIMRGALTPAGIDAVLSRRNLIFEGAQGLLLDQDRGHAFPYLTRSNTGLKNVLAIAKDAGIESLDVVYMTRAYLTRHGAGPLRNERKSLDYADVFDPTNRPNPWQGTLRYAPLDVDVLRDAIHADLADVQKTAIEVTAGVGVSCMDQLRGRGDLVASGSLVSLPASAVLQRIAETTGLPVKLESHGPTRRSATLLPPPRPRAA